MLGERRSNSLFAPAAPAEPERKPEQAEVHDISFEERTGRSLFAEAKQRRITNISECEILPDGSRRLHKLYEYHITDNHLEGDRFVIEGEHQKCEEISESLRRRFIENGMPLGELAQFVQGKEKDA